MYSDNHHIFDFWDSHAWLVWNYDRTLNTGGWYPNDSLLGFYQAESRAQLHL